MRHGDHEVFIAAIEGRKRVRLTFVSKEDGGRQLVRHCAPMDYGPGRVAKSPDPRYHLWDFDSDSSSGPHTLSLLAPQIVSMVETDQDFDPAEFVSWEPRWHHVRDWGRWS